jgi:hypothetical protein
MMRLATGTEVEWVEGWVLPPADWREGWLLPTGTKDVEVDCPAYGRLGLSGGIVCEIPAPVPDRRVQCRVSLRGESGRAWLNAPNPVLIQGRAAESTPVYPEFLNDPEPPFFTAVVERLMRAFDTGEEALCSGYDYRQALEIAVALKLSAERGHERVHLPLKDRSHTIIPRPYRLVGGDVAGWKKIGYEGPPEVV